MKYLRLFAFLLLAMLVVSSVMAEEIAEEVQLFDGQSFDGWEGDIEDTWRIENGTLTAGSLEKEAARNEFLSTKQVFRNFDLKLKYKIIGDHKINAGVQFRTKRIPDHHEVIGFQAEISPAFDGNLYDESRRRKFLAKPQETLRKKAQAAVGADGWNTYRILAVGNRIQLWLNGVQTVDYTETDESIEKSGIIAIQIHGGMKGTVSFKDLVLRPLAD